MTRLSTSRPKRSVPNGACALGFDSIRSKFCSSGGTGASTPANRAMPTTTSAKTAPITTTVLRATRRRLFVGILRDQEPRRERRRVSRRHQRHRDNPLEVGEIEWFVDIRKSAELESLPSKHRV